MPTFTFRAVRRESSGQLGPTLHEQTIIAGDEIQAVERAKAIDLDMAALGANAVYVSAADGRAVWSLHVAALIEDMDARPAAP